MVTASFVERVSSSRMGAGTEKVCSKAEPAQRLVKLNRRPIMLLYLRNKLENLGLTYHQFFETAYQWRFNPPQVPSLNDDYCSFLLHGVLPRYVVAYLKHLQEKETCTAPDASEPLEISQR